MSEIKVGAVVRVKNPEQYLSFFAKKIAARDAVVEIVGPTPSGQFKNKAKVRFLKRNGRGKEFVEWMYVSELIVTGVA